MKKLKNILMTGMLAGSLGFGSGGCQGKLKGVILEQHFGKSTFEYTPYYGLVELESGDTTPVSRKIGSVTFNRSQGLRYSVGDTVEVKRTSFKSAVFPRYTIKNPLR